MPDPRYKAAGTGPDVDAFIAYCELAGKRRATLVSYLADLTRLPLMFPRLTLEQVTDAELAQVFTTFPLASRGQRMSRYGSFFKWARMTRRIADNPMDYLERPRKPRRKSRANELFSDAEVEALLSLPTEDAAPLALLVDAGLRRGDLSNMRMRHCDPNGKYVQVIDGKGGKDRLIPMMTRLRNHLVDVQILEGLDPDDYVLYRIGAGGKGRYRNRPVGEATFWRWWDRCLRDAGLEHRRTAAGMPRGTGRAHLLRHTFATNWLRRGLAAEHLQIILGHESIETTVDEYVHIDIDDVARAMALIEAVPDDA